MNRLIICHHQKGGICWDSMNPFEYLLSILVITNNQPRLIAYLVVLAENRERQSSRTTEIKSGKSKVQGQLNDGRGQLKDGRGQLKHRLPTPKSLTSWANGLGLRRVRPKEYICRYDLIGS